MDATLSLQIRAGRVRLSIPKCEVFVEPHVVALILPPHVDRSTVRL